MAVVGFTVVLVSVLVTVAVPVLPDAPPVVPVPKVGVDHLYVVPAGMTPVGVYEKATVLQVTPVCEVIVAIGLTVTDTVKGAPAHVPGVVVGVTLYVAVAATESVLPSVPFSCACPVPKAPPVIPVPDGEDQA